MALTPNDILNKEFSSKFRGYDTNEVNDYLDIIVSDYEALIAEKLSLQQELSAAKEKNDYFAQLQDSLNSSIVVAQEAADRLKQNARKEAELIIYEAEREADRVITHASETAKSIVTESDALRRSSKTYRNKLEDMIKGQLDLVQSPEYLELFDKEIETSLNPSHFIEASERVNKRVDRLEELEEATTSTENLEETRVISATELNELSNQKDFLDESSFPAATELIPSDDLSDNEQIVDDSFLGQTIRIDLPKE